MSDIRKELFLKELRKNKDYMRFLHSSLLNSKFTILIAVFGVLTTAAEYRTGGAFSGFVLALLVYLLNYLAILHTAAPSFAMRGRILSKEEHDEYVDYVVENRAAIRRVVSDNHDFEIGDEVFLYRFDPSFFFSFDKTGIAAA